MLRCEEDLRGSEGDTRTCTATCTANRLRALSQFIPGKQHPQALSVRSVHSARTLSNPDTARFARCGRRCKCCSCRGPRVPARLRAGSPRGEHGSAPAAVRGSCPCLAHPVPTPVLQPRIKQEFKSLEHSQHYFTRPRVYNTEQQLPRTLSQLSPKTSTHLCLCFETSGVPTVLTACEELLRAVQRKSF